MAYEYSSYFCVWLFVSPNIFQYLFQLPVFFLFSLSTTLFRLKKGKHKHTHFKVKNIQLFTWLFIRCIYYNKRKQKANSGKIIIEALFVQISARFKQLKCKRERNWCKYQPKGPLVPRYFDKYFLLSLSIIFIKKKKYVTIFLVGFMVFEFRLVLMNICCSYTQFY